LPSNLKVKEIILEDTIINSIPDNLKCESIELTGDTLIKNKGSILLKNFKKWE